MIARRKFLQGAGIAVAGIGAAGTVGLLVGKAGISGYAQAAEKAAAEPAPLPYVKLDPGKAAEKGYQSYFKGG
jgi:hypothetical protein